MPQRSRVDVPALLRAAVEGHEAHKSIAADLGYKPDYWTRVLDCERGIVLDRLSHLPYGVQVDFVVGWASALGLRVDRRRDKTAQQFALTALVEAVRALTEGDD